MKSLFVETSAFLQVVFRETGFEQTAKALSQADFLIASRLLRVEAERAVLRVSQHTQNPLKFRSELDIVLRACWPQFDFVEMTPHVCSQAGLIAPDTSLRTLDAIHLASYYWLKAKIPDLKMLSNDKRILAHI